MVFPDKQTNKNQIMAEKEPYTFSELCMCNVFIHIIIFFNVGTDNVDY